MPARNQSELLEQYMMRNGQGQEVVDQLKLPGLTKIFTLPATEDRRTDNVRLPEAKKLPEKKREDIADVLVNLVRYRPGVVGIDWNLSSANMQVTYATKGDTALNVPEEDLKAVFMNILKARRRITNLRWDFDKDYVEVKCLV